MRGTVWDYGADTGKPIQEKPIHFIVYVRRTKLSYEMPYF
jgi:hypothetical protein